jgi:hypothetical protein
VTSNVHIAKEYCREHSTLHTGYCRGTLCAQTCVLMVEWNNLFICVCDKDETGNIFVESGSIAA